MPKKKGKTVVGKRHKSSLIPMAVSTKPRKHKVIRHKKAVKR